jgi:hypothetical protein
MSELRRHQAIQEVRAKRKTWTRKDNSLRVSKGRQPSRKKQAVNKMLLTKAKSGQINMPDYLKQQDGEADLLEDILMVCFV